MLYFTLNSILFIAKKISKLGEMGFQQIELNMFWYYSYCRKIDISCNQYQILIQSI